ncbi:alpha/beta fold hydrolase [Arsenicicoccus bolidensis]|uniref:Alpha/beta hydrolase n=1 Tax=Arsenicicoccus bolidensis TaxID=229480 RepID=A0ABS9Q0G0_9MICO|nr:alpha/beta hydrolase [Arsenicicoccus bolidensis]MCG7320690.1 alpha/beta hydrolase [Arsenicicoccus bolidensis]
MLTTLLDGQVMAEKHGSGSPRVLAMHGWARNRHDWATVLGGGDGYDAVAVDLAGFGATPPPEDGWSTEQYAESLLPLLGPASPLVLMGHSFGGRVAMHLARLRPDAVRGLVLTGVPLLRPDASGAPARKGGPLDLRIAKALHARGIVPESVVDKYRKKYGSADYNAAQGVMRTVLVKAVNEDYTRELEAVRAAGIPVEMVWGEGDTAATVPMARRAAEIAGPTARLEVVPGSSHLIDAALTAQLRAALDRLLADAPAELPTDTTADAPTSKETDA